jgi:hypothetical protein
VLHILLQGAQFVDGKVSCAWAVSINAVEAFLRAVTEESAVLADVGAFSAVFSRSVARLSTDVAADVLCGTSALICCMGQDMAPAALFKGNEVGGEVHGQSAPEHVCRFSYDSTQFSIRVGEDHGEGTLLFGNVFKSGLGPHRAFNDAAVLVWEVMAKLCQQLFTSGEGAVFVTIDRYAGKSDPGLSFVRDKVENVGAERLKNRLAVFPD